MRRILELIAPCFAPRPRAPTEPFPNSHFGEFAAKKFLIRGLQLALGDLVYVKTYSVRLGTYQNHLDCARGPKAMFDIDILVTFTTSDSSGNREAFASLCIACESQEHLWEPNHSGSYICIDGTQHFHVETDFLSGNISLAVEGRGSHIPDEFRSKCSAIDWGTLHKP